MVDQEAILQKMRQPSLHNWKEAKMAAKLQKNGTIQMCNRLHNK